MTTRASKKNPNTHIFRTVTHTQTRTHIRTRTHLLLEDDISEKAVRFLFILYPEEGLGK